LYFRYLTEKPAKENGSLACGQRSSEKNAVDTNVDAVIESYFQVTQDHAARKSELFPFCTSMLSSIVDVYAWQQMLTTHLPGDKVPACNNGLGCQAYRVTTDISGRCVDPSIIRPFQILVTGDQRTRLERGDTIPCLDKRICAACYVHELLLKSVIGVADGGEEVYDLGKSAYVPRIVAQTCPGPSKSSEFGDQFLHDVGKVVKGVCFSSSAVSRYTLMGSPSPCCVPRFDASASAWMFLTDVHEREDGLCRMQIHCGHMAAEQSSLSWYGKTACIRAPPRKFVYRVVLKDLGRGLSCIPSKSQLLKRWVARTADQHAMDAKCHDCKQYLLAVHKTEKLTPLSCYYMHFFGCTEGLAHNMIELDIVLRPLFKIMSGVSCKLPKSFKCRVASMFMWLDPSPFVSHKLQKCFYDSKKRPVVPKKCNSAPASRVFAKQFCDISVSRDLPPSQFSSAPTFLSELQTEIGKARFDRVLRVAVCYALWCGAIADVPEYAAESGVFNEMAKCIVRASRDRRCCKAHTLSRMTLKEVLLCVSRLCKFSLPPSTMGKDVFPSRNALIGFSFNTPKTKQASLVSWVREESRILRNKGPLLVFDAPKDVVDIQRWLVSKLITTSLYYCAMCGETSALPTSVDSKKDRRNKSFAVDMMRHYSVCRLRDNEPVALCPPSFGVYLKMHLVWWVRCGVCCQLTEAYKTCHAQYNLHVCLKCASHNILLNRPDTSVLRTQIN
jgi:hypothetical protein